MKTITFGMLKKSWLYRRNRMSTCQSVQQIRTKPQLEVPQENDPSHKLRLEPRTLKVYLYVFRSWLRRTLNILQQEIHSFFLRIPARYREPNYFPVTRSYSSCSPIQRRFLSSYNRARSACISKMASNHPWATRADLRLFLDGWDMGEKWASQTYNPESCTEQLVANTQDQS